MQTRPDAQCMYPVMHTMMLGTLTFPLAIFEQSWYTNANKFEF